MDIFVVDAPTPLDDLLPWIDEHVDRGQRAQKARGLVLQLWHDELLCVSATGKVITSDFLADSDVISRADHAKLKAFFRQFGKQVDTIPGRRPPKKSSDPKKQSRIEAAGE
jgi:hypothetical protein